MDRSIRSKCLFRVQRYNIYTYKVKGGDNKFAKVLILSPQYQELYQIIYQQSIDSKYVYKTNRFICKLYKI